MRRKPTRRRPRSETHTPRTPRCASRPPNQSRRLDPLQRPRCTRAIASRRNPPPAIAQPRARRAAPVRIPQHGPKPPKAHGPPLGDGLPRRLQPPTASTTGPHKRAHTNGHAEQLRKRRAQQRKRLASGQRRLRLSDAKPSTPAWGQRNGHSNGAKPPRASQGHGQGEQQHFPYRQRPTQGRPAGYAASSRNTRKPALTAGTRAGNSKRFGFTARPKPSRRRRSADESGRKLLAPPQPEVIVAIDGPAGAGKSTIARHLAQHLAC